MRAFDRQFTPPAPVADVIVTNPVSVIGSGVLPGKLDTGADLTVIPESLVAELGLIVRGFTMEHSPSGQSIIWASASKTSNCLW